jgi:hypothetical protein
MMVIVASDCYFKDALESDPLKEINILISGFVLEFVHNYELSKEEFLSLTHQDYLPKIDLAGATEFIGLESSICGSELGSEDETSLRTRYFEAIAERLRDPGFQKSNGEVFAFLERCHSKFVVRALEGFVTDLNTTKQTVKRLEHLRDCYGLC